MINGKRTAAFVLITMTYVAAPATAQWSTAYEQTYLPASHNWAFRENYAAADRLFNAFDYGHAILYETLYRRSDAPVTLLEEEIYDRLTKDILVRPPRLPLEESAIEIAYARLAPEAKIMFDWAHILHRQAYDIWADESIPEAEKDARMAEVLAYYRSRPDVAFSTSPKSMELMDGQYYSLAFRERFPKFNGLIWAYHWLQVGLYEPLMLGGSPDERQSLVNATVARFWQMLENAPESMPYLMPMTAAVAPTFAERYPQIAIIFDNLHMMHDVVSDILASPEVPRDRKRAEIIRAVSLFRDDESFLTSVDEWRGMAIGMGIHNQGGPAVGFTADLPTPTVPRGMSMAGMDHAQVDHSAHAQPDRQAANVSGRDEHAGHMEQAPAVTADSAAVVATVGAFHSALAAGDSAGVLALLADDAVILETGGTETKEEYRSGHLQGDIAFARAVAREAGSIRVTVAGDVAWASSVSTIRGTYRDREVNSRSAELMVLRRTGGDWRIAAIHWSSRAVRQD